MKRSILFSVALSVVGCGEKPAPPTKEPAPNAAKAPEAAQTPAVDLRKLPDTEAKSALSLDQWKQVNDPSQTETLTDIAFGDGVYVAIGNNETILTSTNAIVWERQRIEGLDGAQQIAFGDKKFLLRSRTATYRSSDGKAWTAVKDAPERGEHLSFLNAQFTQVLFGNRFFTSADGLTWSVSISEELPEGLIAYGAGVFVVADFAKATEDASPRLYSFSSADGKLWEKAESGEGSGVITGLLYAKELFLLLQGDGQLLTSVDGKSWKKGEKLSDQRVFAGLTACGDRLLLSASDAAAGAALFSSEDAKTWTKHSFAFPKGINGFACGEGVAVAIGVEGSIFIAKL